MTTEQKIIHDNARLPWLDVKLGNVSQACKMLGTSFDTFYHFKRGRLALTRLLRGQLWMALAELHPRATTGSSRTALDRYPELFRATSEQMPDARRILSYGCSTGEECATLKGYFTAAEIVGTDINFCSLARARKRFSSERIRFVYARRSALSEFPQFDVICAMSVLRGPKNRSVYYPFKKFEEDVAFLDSLLKQNGLLLLTGTTYRFCDTSTAKRYELVPTPVQDRWPDERPTFYRDGTFGVIYKERPTSYPDGNLAGIYTEKLFRKTFVTAY